MTKKENNTPKRRGRGPSTHYVNNKDFYAALKDYKDKCNLAEKEHKKKVAQLQKEHKKSKSTEEFIAPPIVWPRIPEYIGECIFLIANKLSNAPNFCSYSFKDEMVADGIEDCILRIRSFDPNVSTNPFAYFTQTCYFAAVRRIKKEKKQKTVKSEMIRNSAALEYFQDTHNNVDGHNENSYLQFLMENLDVVKTDAEKQEHKVFKKTTKAYQKKMKDRQEEIDKLERDIDSRHDDFENKRPLEENDLEVESTKEYYDNLED